MAPTIPSASVQLSYPLYACDFDPQDANRLILGGGGGPGRSGVSNKISVLDVSHQDSLQVVSELDLSRDEDSVNTIAVGPRRRNSILVFAGINSSPADVAKGKNEHFRVFTVDQPSKAKAVPKITELSRSALFSSTEADAYQRVLRISQPLSDRPQIGAVATGFAKEPQIAIFDVPPSGTTAAAPTAPKLRGRLELSKEAVDLDVIQTGDGEWQMVYCDDYEMYTVNIGKKTSDPRCVFTMPHDDYPRPSFRSIRYLTPTFVLAVGNLPKAGGVVLNGFRLPKPDQAGVEGKARLAVSARLPKSIKRATGMAARSLSPPSAPSARHGDAQFVVAVAGADSSITLYKLDHQAVGDISLLANLHPIATLPSVHPGPISGLAFSHFAAPRTATMRLLNLKLASIGSMGNSCVVHSIPLKRLVEKGATGVAARLRNPRYVVALKGRAPSARNLLLGLAILVAVLCIIAQTVLEVNGLSPSLIGARKFTPSSWHVPVGTDRAAGAGVGAGLKTEPLLAEYLAGDGSGGSNGNGNRVVVLDTGEHGDEGVKVVDAHDEEAHGPAVEWHELPAEQKAAWKEKLKKAGHWGENMGETILKSILFGEIGGAVGGAVADL